MFAERIAMISDKDDGGIAPKFLLVQFVQQFVDLGVRKKLHRHNTNAGIPVCPVA
jgi:hypothetical protein